MCFINCTDFQKISSIYIKIKYFGSLLYDKNVVFGHGLMIEPFPPTNSRSSQINLNFNGGNSIGAYSLFQGSGKIVFGKRSYCGEFCIFGVNDSIIIGEDVMIATSVTIRDTDHQSLDTKIPMNKQGIVCSSVVIEDDVWLGHGVTILKGVRIGRGSIVAAGAVVTRDVEAYTTVGGVPAKRISRRIG